MSRRPAREPPRLRTASTKECMRLTSSWNGQETASTNMLRSLKPHDHANRSVQNPYSPLAQASSELGKTHPGTLSARGIGHERSCVFQIHQMNFMDDDVCSEGIGQHNRRMGCRPGLGYEFHRLTASFRLSLRGSAARPEIRKSLFARPRAGRSRTGG